jgi:hypothetical protein
MGAKPYPKRGIKMKYKEFMEITDKWSDNDVVCFLMEYPLWNEMVMRFIMHKWRDSCPIELEEIVFFAQDNNIMEYTQLPEVEE